MACITILSFVIQAPYISVVFYTWDPYKVASYIKKIGII